MTTQQYMYLVDIRFAQGLYYTLSHLYRVQQTMKYTQSKGSSGMIQIPNTLKLQEYRDYRFLRKPEVKPSAPERVSVSCLKQNTNVELQNSSNDKFYILPTIISNTCIFITDFTQVIMVVMVSVYILWYLQTFIIVVYRQIQHLPTIWWVSEFIRGQDVVTHFQGIINVNEN